MGGGGSDALDLRGGGDRPSSLGDQPARAAARVPLATGGARRRLAGDPGYWGGQLSHIGVALAAVGLAAAANLATHTEVDLVPGDTASFAGYELTYLTPFLRNEPNRTVTGATVVVERDGEVVTVQPRINEYPGTGAGIVTPAVHSSLRGRPVSHPDPDRCRGITLQLDTTPAVWLIWLGGLVAASAEPSRPWCAGGPRTPASAERARV